MPNLLIKIIDKMGEENVEKLLETNDKSELKQFCENMKIIRSIDSDLLSDIREMCKLELLYCDGWLYPKDIFIYGEEDNDDYTFKNNLIDYVSNWNSNLYTIIESLGRYEYVKKGKFLYENTPEKKYSENLTLKIKQKNPISYYYVVVYKGKEVGNFRELIGGYPHLSGEEIVEFEKMCEEDKLNSKNLYKSDFDLREKFEKSLDKKFGIDYDV